MKCGSDGKQSSCNAEDLASIPGWGRSLGEGNDYPLQCSCLENSMDRGAWWDTVHGVTKSQTRLHNPYFNFSSMICGAESYDFLPFVYLFWWSFYSDILPIFKLDYLFSC